MTDLQRSRAELRAAVMLAGKEIRKLNVGRADSRSVRRGVGSEHHAIIEES